jgi:hypothetical protein
MIAADFKHYILNVLNALLQLLVYMQFTMPIQYEPPETKSDFTLEGQYGL